MEISFDIGALFEQHFGYKSPAFDPKFTPLPLRKETSAIGTPYWAKDAKGREYFMPITLGGVQLPYPVISVNTRKNVVSTPMANRRGTVNEQISIDDYYFTIRGLAIGPVNEFPEDDIKALRDLYERNESLEIVSAFTDVFLANTPRSEPRSPSTNQIDKVIILSLDVPEVRGIIHVRPYEMTLKADSPFTLYV